MNAGSRIKLISLRRRERFIGQELKHLIEILGEVKSQSLKPVQIRSAYTAIAEKGLAVQTQRKVATHLTSALKDAVDLEVLARNPAAGVKVRTPRVTAQTKPWTRQEAAAFLKVAENDPLYGVFYVMLATGLRRGEALGLSWTDVDAEAKVLRIRQALTMSGDGNTFRLSEVKTPRSRRALHVGNDVLTVLQRQREGQLRAQEVVGEAWGDSDLIFTTSVGTPVSPRNLQRSFKRLTLKAGLRTIRLHDLRHTYASLALQKRLSVEVVSARLGHTSVGFLSTYRHLYESEKQEAAVELGDLLGDKDRGNL